MDIQKAASYGWNRKRTITLSLRDLTPSEVGEHSFLDKYLSEAKEMGTMIYCMNYMTRKEGIKERGPEDLNVDIVVNTGRGESDNFASLSMGPEFKKQDGYEDFLLKMVKHLGGGEKDIYHMPELLVWDEIVGNIWNGAKTVGHKEIAELADYFDKEFVRKHKRGARTRIFITYGNLTPKEILKMKYNPKKVVEFDIE